MGTTIKLYYTDRNNTYKNWELLPQRLIIVEDISAYLATKAALTINNFQYQKNELEIGINVDLAEAYSQPKSSINFKYVSIQNQGELTHYYFIKKATWRSKSCVRFELIMDVLNTFQEGQDYTWKANTKITREHKDRYTSTKAMTCGIDYLIQVSAGSINEGDRVVLNNDRGEEVFKGKIIFIDSSYVNIQIENPTSEEDYTALIEPYLNLRFELVKVDAPANYIAFTPTTMQDFNFTKTMTYYRKIDYVPEGINPLLIKKEEPVNIQDSGIRNQTWYLLYRNANNPSPDEFVNPVECYLIPENETKTDAAYISGGRLVPSWVEDNKWYVFKIDYGKSLTLSNGVSLSATGTFVYYLVITKNDNTLSVSCYRTNSTGDYLNIYWTYDGITYITFNTIPVNYHIFTSFDDITATDLTNTSYERSFSNSEDKNVIDGIASFDRADAKNIKCIKLPYCPFRFSYSGDTLEVNGNAYWERASFTQSQGGDFYALHLINNVKLENTLNAAGNNPFSNLKVSITDIREDDLRDTEEVDSKLFHSDFYSPSYVYDSFAIKVDLEKCDLDYYINNGTTTNNIKFNMTSTINSKFMFTIEDYHSNKSEQNFYNVMPIARNNEEVLYNVPYINYIRTGFNYDIKAKNLQNASNFIGMGMSVAAVGASLLAPSVPLKVAGVVASLVSMAMSVKSAVVSAVQSEENIKQKLTQYQNQAASVAGSDDVDLMTEYCNNRLKYMIYEPTDVMKNLINDLFFYAGYASNRMGIPTHNNRLNFDYLECDASIEAAASIPEECLEELINCFKSGITYIHKTSRASDKWDFEQKYENWERSLLED